MNPISVSIKNTSNNELPAYATTGAAGMDIRAWLQEPMMMKPMERVLIPTGLFLEIPNGYEAQVRPRSGLAIKFGITVLNSPGTIDSDYRGEVKVILVNLSQEDYTVQPGERIAQMIFQPVSQVKWEEKTELANSERGAGGFGHSGHH